MLDLTSQCFTLEVSTLKQQMNQTDERITKQPNGQYGYGPIQQWQSREEIYAHAGVLT